MTATRRSSMDGHSEADHTFARVEEGDEGYVLRCRCGWASPSSRSAEVVGTAWDRHRDEIGARNN